MLKSEYTQRRQRQQQPVFVLFPPSSRRRRHCPRCGWMIVLNFLCAMGRRFFFYFRKWFVRFGRFISIAYDDKVKMK